MAGCWAGAGVGAGMMACSFLLILTLLKLWISVWTAWEFPNTRRPFQLRHDSDVARIYLSNLYWAQLYSPGNFPFKTSGQL